MLLRSTALYLPANLLGPLLQLGTIIALSHWLAPSALGLYALVIAVQDLAQIATLSWWSQYVLRFLDGHETDLRARQDRTEMSLLLATGAVQATLIAASLWLFGWEGWSLDLMGAAASAGALRAMLTHAAVRARATQRIALHSLAQLGGPGLSLVFSLAAFATIEASVTAAFWGVALAHALLLPIVLLRLNYRCSLSGLRVDDAILQQGLHYGLFTTAGAALAWVTLQSTRFIIDFTLGATAVGLVFVGWGIGQRIATQIGVLATTAVFPLAAQRAREDSVAAGLSVMVSAAPVLLGLLIPAVIGVAYVAEPLATLVAPETYRAVTAQILPLATLTGAIRVFRNHFLDEMLQLDERNRTMALLDLGEAVLTVLFCLVGAWAGGIWGALLGCLLATSCATVLALLITGRLYGAPIPLRDLRTIAAASCTMVVTLELTVDGAGIGVLATRIALGALAYLAICLILDRRLLAVLSLRR